MKLPYAEVAFDKKGRELDGSDRERLDELLALKRPTDLIVISHGWNNTHGQARALYERFIDSLVAVRPRVDGAGARRFVVVGMLWPSILWAPAESDGAGAGVGGEEEALIADIRARVDDEDAAAELIALVPQLETSGDAQKRFVDVLRATLPEFSEGEDAAGFEALRTADTADVLDAARALEDEQAAPAAVGGAAVIDPAGLSPLDPGGPGGGAGLFDSILRAGRGLVNVTTYYTMKERAGVVGAQGIAPLLAHLHEEEPAARIHLVGHSFGGRAVTAAALASTAPVASLSLLQAAYSHFGMARAYDDTGADGAFVGVPERVRGPVIITHTVNDKAVGLAYPVASRLARQIGVGLGDAADPYGGIGRNGALKTPGATTADLGEVGATYALAAGRVTSLRADRYIGDHSDVTGREVAYAVLCAVMSASAP
jgi:hypothetical protein